MGLFDFFRKNKHDELEDAGLDKGWDEPELIHGPRPGTSQYTSRRAGR